MSITTKLKKLSVIANQPSNFVCQTKYLFVFSHMRSRSSVLSHVLGSNLDICGYGELHMPYYDRKSLINMRINIVEDLRCQVKNKYLLDKILHDYGFAPEIWEIAKPKVIFIIREPESSIKSIINLGLSSRETVYSNPLNAFEYYCSRLRQLEEYAVALKGNYFFIESDDLVNTTDSVLNNLSTWLNLNQPLDKHYSQFANTGKVGYGDPSANIRSGVIVKTQRNSNISLDCELLREARYVYDKCKNTLESACL